MDRRDTCLLICCFFLALLLHASTVHSAWLPPPGGKSPDLRSHGEQPAAGMWPGRIPASDPRGYDVLAYCLELEFVALPPQTPLIDGTCQIRLRLLNEPPRELRIDLVNHLSVSEVLRDGLPVVWTHAGDSLRVALPAAPQPGAEHLVSIRYAGSPPRHGPFQAGLLMRHRGVSGPHDPDDLGPTVGNVSQPYSSHSWFPCKDHPSDKATFDMSVIAPDSLGVVATGRLLSTVDLPGDRRRWNWSTEYPVAPYLVGLAVSNFTTWDEICDAVPLEFHVFAEHLAEAKAILAPTCAMLHWLEERLGPYPFAGEKYAQVSFRWFGAMENQTVTMLGQTVLSMPVRTAQLYVLHELVHHWFGNSLTPSHWRDIWLNEGFARYGEALWIEHTEGQQAYRDFMEGQADSTLFAGAGFLGDPDPVLPNLMIYKKGAWVLHMLRHELGDDLFFTALRQYAQEPTLVHAHTDRAAFLASFGRTTGRDLAPWLAPWLDTEAVPEFGARWRSVGGSRTLIEVVQVQSEPFFPLTVPLRVHAGPEIIDLRLKMNDLLAGETITTSAPVDSVQVDPNNWLLKRTTALQAPGLLVEAPRPNPASGSIELVYWLEGTDRVTAAVYDVIGRLVYHRELGMQPATGSPEGGGQPLRWFWDGQDRAGRCVAAGVYWLELRTSRDRTARKVALVR